jgi:DNA-binding ferritin-like protein
LPETDSNSFWRLYSDEELDCRERLEALLAGYGHYSRSAYDSIRSLERSGDVESIKVVQKLIAVAEKGLCFIELYLEGLALHMDGNRLPPWPVSADIV